MFGYEIGFNAPYYLVLLLLIPVVWIWSYKSLAGLGPLRRFLALAFRSVILLDRDGFGRSPVAIGQ